MSSQVPLTQSLKKSERDYQGTSYSEAHDLYAKLKALELASSKEARVTRLLLDNSCSYNGFNAFFLPFIAGAESLAKKLIVVKQEDKIDVSLFKNFFKEKIGDNIFRALDYEGGFPQSFTIFSDDICDVMHFVMNKQQRAERLTRRTLLSKTTPRPLMVCPFKKEQMDHPFYKEEIKEFVEDFLEHRDEVINLRAKETIDEQPRAYEYFSNFIRKVGLNVEQLKAECEIVFLDEYSLDQEDRLPLKSTSDFFLEEQRVVTSNFVVFIRPPTWDVECADPFFPSLSFECSDASSKKNRYQLKGFSFSEDIHGESFCGAVFDRQTLYTWSRKRPKCQLAEDLQEELEQIDHLMKEKMDLTDFSYNHSISLINHLDFCIYEKQ